MQPYRAQENKPPEVASKQQDESSAATPAKDDRFESFAELSHVYSRSEAFEILAKRGNSGVLLIAPHGGSIEPGTDKLAAAIAGQEHSLYAFIGKLPAESAWDLHVTSSRFDEPQALELLSEARQVVSIHCCRGSEPCVYLVGLDEDLIEAARVALNRAGFVADFHKSPNLQGVNPLNVCNRGRSAKGLQLEISQGLFEELDGRPEVYRKLVTTLRELLKSSET